MHEITINIDDVKKAYREAKNNKDIQNLLINLFGKKIIDITERIKTFEDAYDELGCEHPYCLEWDSIYQGGNKNDDCEDIKDVIAYHKLRIIAAALNEGWKPKFTKDEYRYYTYYCFYTKQEYDNLSDEEKKTCRAVGSAYYKSAFSITDADIRIAFKNWEPAKYAGQQFFDIYADFLA